MQGEYIGDRDIEDFLYRVEKEFPDDFEVIREIKERLNIPKRKRERNLW